MLGFFVTRTCERAGREKGCSAHNSAHPGTNYSQTIRQDTADVCRGTSVSNANPTHLLTLRHCMEYRLEPTESPVTNVGRFRP